jgi:sugar (pentulose or hexulose) kinase
MYFIPLNQAESVELVIHALHVAAGTADCTTCPVRRVCMKQCATLGAAIAHMWQAGQIPSDDPEPSPPKISPEPTVKGAKLRLVK